ncbi:hypothetical protein C6P82_17195 [Burkholderia multivorans]|nr:hypothetical protein C6P82_17195 [Burkholderia multivorans]
MPAQSLSLCVRITLDSLDVGIKLWRGNVDMPGVAQLVQKACPICTGAAAYKPACNGVKCRERRISVLVAAIKPATEQT